MAALKTLGGIKFNDLPTIEITKVITDIGGNIAAKVKVGWFASIDPKTGKCVMVAGKGALFFLESNGVAQGYTFARVV